MSYGLREISKKGGIRVKDNRTELQKAQGIVEKVILEISCEQAELTAAKLRGLILTKKPGLNKSDWWTQLSTLHIVQSLIEEGRVVGRIESGNSQESPRIFFNVEANIHLFTDSQYKKVEHIKRSVLELGTKFTRLQVAEIAESCNVPDEALIITTIQDMIGKRQIDAQYFTSTKAVAFNQQANLQSQDTFIAELDAEFANWGMDSKK